MKTLKIWLSFFVFILVIGLCLDVKAMMYDGKKLRQPDAELTALYDKIKKLMDGLSRLKAYLSQPNNALIEHPIDDDLLEKIEQLNPDLDDRQLSIEVVSVLSSLNNHFTTAFTKLENLFKSSAGDQGIQGSLACNHDAAEPLKEPL